jgi:hypothetical protein
MYLVAADTSGIQSYIFGSNRLRENIGASHLVKQATGSWALEAVKEAARLSTIPKEDNLAQQPCIEGEDGAAEVIYSGGGNIVVLFKDKDNADDFMWTLSERVLCEAPGLLILMACSDKFDWSHDALTQVQQRTFDKLSVLKRNRPPAGSPLSLGVTLPCQSTGLPAIKYAGSEKDRDQYPVSADVLAKHEALNGDNGANAKLRDALETAMGDDQHIYAFPFDLDNLGRDAGENSLISVVHADGNGIGKRVLHLAAQFGTADKNRKYVTEMREFSRRMNDCAGKALQATLQTLVERIVHADRPDQSDRYEQLVHINRQGDELAAITLKKVDRVLYPGVPQDYFLPFRPIVFGGDDVTFVCDGRLGVSLAIEYLQQFEEFSNKPETGLLDWGDENQKVVKGATSSAGVAIVKTHYPFARAYALAEDLCNNAKRLNWPVNTLDWHYALSGLFGDIDDIRAREYSVPTGSLTVRPIALRDNVPDVRRTWSVVEKGLDAFQSEWFTKRNKSKALRDALRGGPDAVKTFRAKYLRNDSLTQKLPDVGGLLSHQKSWQEEGWSKSFASDPNHDENLCGYFDALELMDLYIPLHGTPNATQTQQPQV